MEAFCQHRVLEYLHNIMYLSLPLTYHLCIMKPQNWMNI